MLVTHRRLRLGRSLSAGLALVLAFASVAQAATGRVRISIAKAGFIVGVGGGTGTLDFKGRRYKLRVDGVTAGTIGIARADLIGTAYNLRQPEDIAGTYSVGSAGISVIGGGKAARLSNENGVVLELKGRQIGVEASLDLGGVSVRLE